MSDQAGLLLLLVVVVLLFTGVGRKWAGRGARTALWEWPKGAAKYTWDSNMALAGDVGRRVTVFVVYGAFLWGARWVWLKFGLPGRWVLSLLLLLWFLYGVNLLRFIRHARAQASRSRQLAREQYRVVHEIRSDVREALAGIGRGRGGGGEGGGFTVLGSLRREDEMYQQVRRTRRAQADQVRDMLPEDQRGMPLGDQFEPLLRWPRFLRRRRS